MQSHLKLQLSSPAIPDSKMGFLLRNSDDEAEEWSNEAKEWSNGHSRSSSTLTDESEISTESFPSLSDSSTTSSQLSRGLESRFNRCLATLTGHVGAVSCLAT